MAEDRRNNVNDGRNVPAGRIKRRPDMNGQAAPETVDRPVRRGENVRPVPQNGAMQKKNAAGRNANIRRTPADVRSRGAESGEHPRTNSGNKMDIREQTPAKRRRMNEEKRIDSENPEVNRAAKRSRGYRVNQPKKKKNRGVFFARVLLFVLVFAVAAGLCALVFYANLISTDPPVYERIRMKICLVNEADTLKSTAVELEEYVRNDVIFVNMTDVAEKFDFVITGNQTELKFITDLKTGENVKFILDTPFAEVNGSSVRLDGIVTRTDGDVFVPVSFFKEYVNGISVEWDEKNSVLSVLRNTSRNEAGRIIESDISFRLKTTEDSPSISEYGLSDEIKNKCYFTTITPVTPVPVA